ncbi:MAG: amino acid permease [Gammaproteobacteria bacterium]|nr:amino acid permease [Gammaproteobacteria bacterium]
MIKNPKKLGVFTLAMISIAGIFNLRTLPLMADYGFASVFYYLLASLLFFIPSALTCAELATGWPKTGGLYVWIREAFGPKIGFLGIWLEWTNTVISFPATLSLIAAILAYAIDPKLASAKWYMVSMMLTLFWGTTFINFLGIKFSSWASNIGFILGTLFPCLLIIGLSIAWFASGKPIYIHFSWHELFPNFHLAHAAFLVGLILGFSGMQVAAFHAQETQNPQKDYPKAMMTALCVILGLSILGSLAIAMIVPYQTLDILTGLMQMITIFFGKFHLAWLVKIIAILSAIGALASLNIWLIGPCKGLLATARYGDLPKRLQHTNQNGAPTTLLISQAAIGTFFALIYLLMPTVTSSYWALVDLSALLTLLAYLLLFSSVIRLRYTHKETERSYKIPGGNVGVWVVAGLGMITCVIAFFLGFMPPSQLKTGNIFLYEGFLVGGIIIVSVIPLIIQNLKFDHSGL